MYLHTATSFLTLALLLLLNQSSLVLAITTGLAPQNIDRTGWVITADSSQQDNGPGNAIDNNDGTIWHTAWGPDAPLPHWLKIDMQNQYVVNGLSYTPRQDGYSNGRIGTHRIEYSLDGNSWTTAAQGTWGNDPTVKTTLFTPVVARWLRLTAIDEATNTGKQWASAAEIDVLRNPHAWLPRQNWAVTVDSFQGGDHNFPAVNAYDSSPTTWWHTPWGTGSPFPHYFSIDQGTANTVAGITYLPRPESTGPNGRIGQYTVQRSSDGNTWTNVVSGTWPDTPTQKVAEWAPITARYWRLVANSEAGNRGSWTSASEINLLDGAVQLANFRITVDSEEVGSANNSASKAMDTDLTTFWHTQWSGANIPGYPHYYTIDMQTNLPVKALEYTPRQDGNKNGNIGQHTIQVSTDNATWTTVATGNFADNAQSKLTFFQETVARYVRLTALSEAGGRGPWASAAEISLQYDTSYVPPAPQTKGQWALTVNFPVVPVAVGLIYNTGGVLAWSSWSEAGFGNTPFPGYTVTATYDVPSGMVSKATISNTQHDMFCPGISLDFNGRFMVTGGNSAAKTSIYNPPSSSWIAAPDMKVARGYQSQTTLSNGWAFQIGGSWSGGVFKKNGEYYNPSTNTWTMLSGTDVTPMLTADPEGIYRSDNHGWLFAWKNQAVFQAGPSKAMNWYTTTGSGGVSSAGTRGDSPDAMCGIAVMYDAVAGKILAAGGSPAYQGQAAITNTYIITIGNVGTQASVQKIASMSYKRIFHNGVVLPNGQVFVVGGQDFGTPLTDESAVMYPELWSPSNSQWTVLAPMAVPRNYHSVAILMPDATIMIGGGGLCDGCSMNHYDGQIFNPPYLFTSSGAKATRPAIISTSVTTVAVGGSITVNTNGAITSVALIRLGTATHTVNTDQRRIPLTPTSVGTNSYRVTVPSDPGIALPGYWMLFVSDSAGVPSVARTIKVTL